MLAHKDGGGAEFYRLSNSSPTARVARNLLWSNDGGQHVCPATSCMINKWQAHGIHIKKMSCFNKPVSWLLVLVNVSLLLAFRSLSLFWEQGKKCSFKQCAPSVNIFHLPAIRYTKVSFMGPLFLLCFNYVPFSLNFLHNVASLSIIIFKAHLLDFKTRMLHFKQCNNEEKMTT